MPLALLSVSDKTGLVPFAARLVELGYSLVSTGGTARTLQEAGLSVRQISDLTGAPEMLGGRVKTLHMSVHGGILARREPEHLAELARHGVAPIDLVAVNLYPFRETVAALGATPDEALENIDIGGVTLLRAAAKNHPAVLVLVDPEDYARVTDVLPDGVTPALRRALARKAFAHTAAYDAAITAWFDRGEALPKSLHLTLERRETLRYGENPHQQGARYAQAGTRSLWARVQQHKGTSLSYLNVLDADAAWQLVHGLQGPACAIIKHANPCGVALAETPLAAYERAFGADPASAFGGVVALNCPVDEATAAAIMTNPKADVLIAPGYGPGALSRLGAKRKAMRVLEAPPPGVGGLELRRVDGGFLVQTPDRVSLERSDWQVVTKRQPSEDEWRDLMLAWQVCARTSSNAIVLVKDGVALGVGAGQQSRVDAARLAAAKAAGRAVGGACASDAFYPFRDGLDAAAGAGVAAVIQPGGSVRDEEVIAAADEHGLAMVVTGRRHFRH